MSQPSKKKSSKEKYVVTDEDLVLECRYCTQKFKISSISKHFKLCVCNHKLDQNKVSDAKHRAREQQKAYASKPDIITKKGLYCIEREVVKFVTEKEKVLGLKELNPGHVLFYDEEDKECIDLLPPENFTAKVKKAYLQLIATTVSKANVKYHRTSLFVHVYKLYKNLHPDKIASMYNTIFEKNPEYLNKEEQANVSILFI